MATLAELYEAARRPAGAEFAVTPRGAAGAARLDEYWVTGPGAAKIRWPEPCSFCRCKRELSRFIHGNKLEGHCANLHKAATGDWPNAQHSREKHCVPC